MSIAPSSWPSSTWSRGSNPSAAKSRGVPTCSRTREVRLPADRCVRLDDVGQRAQRLVGDGRRLVALGLGRLDRRRQLAGRGRATRPCRPRRPVRPACPTSFCSARSGVEAGPCRTPPLVRRDQGVDQRLVLTAGPLRSADERRAARGRCAGRSRPASLPAGAPFAAGAGRGHGRGLARQPPDHLGQLVGRHRPATSGSPAPRRSRAAAAGRSRRASSTPSATAMSPNSCARSTIALTSTWPVSSSSRCVTNERSILSVRSGIVPSWLIDVLPMPKSSTATVMPRSVSRRSIAIARTGSSMIALSVISNSSSLDGSSCVCSRSATNTSRSGSSRLRADRFTATGSSWPCSRHCASCSTTRPSTRAVSLLHEPGALGDRDEVGRRDVAQRRVLPAQQRLEAHHRAGTQVDLGLVVQAQLLGVVQRLPQVAEQHQPAGGVGGRVLPRRTSPRRARRPSPCTSRCRPWPSAR